MSKRKYEEEFIPNKKAKMESLKRKGCFNYESNKRLKPAPDPRDVYIRHLETVLIEMKKKLEVLEYRLQMEQQQNHFNIKNTTLVY